MGKNKGDKTGNCIFNFIFVVKYLNFGATEPSGRLLKCRLLDSTKVSDSVGLARRYWCCWSSGNTVRNTVYKTRVLTNVGTMPVMKLHQNSSHLKLIHICFIELEEPRAVINNFTFGFFQKFNSIKLTYNESLYCIIHMNKTQSILKLFMVYSDKHRYLKPEWMWTGNTSFLDARAGVLSSASSLFLGHFNPATWHGCAPTVLLSWIV